MADNTLFRQKSIDRISSPEELNDYIKVTTTSVWVILIAAMILLAGTLVWGCFGTITVHDDGEEIQIHPIEYILN